MNIMKELEKIGFDFSSSEKTCGEACPKFRNGDCKITEFNPNCWYEWHGNQLTYFGLLLPYNEEINNREKFDAEAKKICE